MKLKFCAHLRTFGHTCAHVCTACAFNLLFQVDQVDRVEGYSLLYNAFNVVLKFGIINTNSPHLMITIARQYLMSASFKFYTLMFSCLSTPKALRHFFSRKAAQSATNFIHRNINPCLVCDHNILTETK